MMVPVPRLKNRLVRPYRRATSRTNRLWTAATVIVALLCIVSACSDSRTTAAHLKNPPTQVYRSQSAGISVRYPSSWTLTSTATGFYNPAFCFQLSSRQRKGRARFRDSHPAAGEVEVRVVELFGGERGRDTRPKHIRVRSFEPPGAVEWTRGRIFAFRDHGRWIYMGVLFGKDVNPQARARTEAALNSLSVSASGRCA
jgi:hypothetical protein